MGPPATTPPAVTPPDAVLEEMILYVDVPLVVTPPYPVLEEMILYVDVPLAVIPPLAVWLLMLSGCRLHAFQLGRGEAVFGICHRC